MKIESLEEALMINVLTGLPLKDLVTEEMLKMTQEQYDRFAYATLRQKAIDSGWKCEDSCLCLRCRKECAE